MSGPSYGLARRYLRAQLKTGALELPLTCRLVTSALDLLQAAQAENKLRGCEHVADAGDTGTMPHAFLAMHGPAAWELRCPACHTDPPRRCQVCERPLAPKVRRVIATTRGHGLVLLGALCADCRPGRVEAAA